MLDVAIYNPITNEWLSKPRWSQCGPQTT